MFLQSAIIKCVFLPYETGKMSFIGDMQGEFRHTSVEDSPDGGHPTSEQAVELDNQLRSFSGLHLIL